MSRNNVNSIHTQPTEFHILSDGLDVRLAPRTLISMAASTSSTQLLLSTTTISSSPGTNNNSDLIALYAIAIPIGIWICAIGVCYPLTYCFYRYCLGLRLAKSDANRRNGATSYVHPFCCCCEFHDTPSDDTSLNTISASVSRQTEDTRRDSAWARTLGLPPSYDVALSMPRPQVGDSVRFQNDVDGGWCTFTWVDSGDDDEHLGPPPQYVDFCRSSCAATTINVVTSAVDRTDVVIDVEVPPPPPPDTDVVETYL